MPFLLFHLSGAFSTFVIIFLELYLAAFHAIAFSAMHPRCPTGWCRLSKLPSLILASSKAVSYLMAHTEH